MSHPSANGSDRGVSSTVANNINEGIFYKGDSGNISISNSTIHLSAGNTESLSASGTSSSHHQRDENDKANFGPQTSTKHIEANTIEHATITHVHNHHHYSGYDKSEESTTGARPKRTAKKESPSTSRTSRTRFKRRAKKESPSTSRSTGARLKQEANKDSTTAKENNSSPSSFVDEEDILSHEEQEKSSSEDSSSSEQNESIAEEPSSTSRSSRTRFKRKAKKGIFQITDDIFINLNKPLEKGLKIYKGYQEHVTGQKLPLAIKAIFPYTKKCIREVKILVNLASHPNVVRIIRSKVQQTPPPTLYIAMELCSPTTLQDYLKEKREKTSPFNFKKAMSYSKGLIGGMQHIHGDRIIHGDLKPQNIVFSLKGDQIKVTDFGISKQLQQFCSATAMTGEGTDGYRAPETYNSDAISLMADIFSLGITLYSLFTNGKHPFGENSDLWMYNIKNNKGCNLSGLPEEIRHKRNEFLNLLGNMLEFDPKKRPTMKEISEHPFFSDNQATTAQVSTKLEGTNYDQPSTSYHPDVMTSTGSISSVTANPNEGIVSGTIGASSERMEEEEIKVSYEELNIGEGNQFARGAFGKVVFCEFQAQKVAVKIQQLNSQFKMEIEILRSLFHNNIIGFLGWGERDSDLFLVMEYLDKNLQEYVNGQISDENLGLSSRITWEMAKQLVQAMFYLHNLNTPIAHGDLTPNNILVDTNSIIPKLKVCDFGLSRRTLDSHCGERVMKKNVRYYPGDKEFREPKSMEDLLLFDVFAYGLVVLFMRTGIVPYEEKSSDTLLSEEREKRYRKKERSVSTSPLVMKYNGKYFIGKVQLPYDLTVLGMLIKVCCKEATKRPSFRQIREEYFGKNVANPFNLSETGEFFECGFLKDTQIFVADSITTDSETAEDKPTSTPPGYRREDLICAVEVKDRPYHDKPEKDEDLRTMCLKHYRTFRKMAKEKKIDDSRNIALAELITDRSGDDESQKVELRYKEKTYCHHRAMREIWRSFEPGEKEELIPCLSVVHPLYSTSFGLHVAILTNEGPGKNKKFVFIQRSNKPGIKSPGSYTCGVVQSCSVNDYLTPEKVKELVPNADPEKAYISLVDTAARGLEEALGLPLSGTDRDAITLNVIFLKFDDHEWEIGGFIDLTSEKIRKENRVRFEVLNAMFTSGPKNKYENQRIQGVDFELRNVVEWIRGNHDKLTSSSKIVAVKVLQSFFGVLKVAEEFSNNM